tara:strand:+ start:352 stop:600 length:249 start_codon:yes stop_codon:yes gene_type:complete
MSTVDGKKEKILGMDLDPDDRLKMTTDKEGYPSCTIDNKKCDVMDYLDASQENAERHFKGKKARSIGMFSGITFDENGKIVR